ncbi:hypothetical protein [Iamia sp.]|uniref:hypothetical protein n=1 Tax=Iamia sp. TaxID=2722710 RepID=UPI002CBA40FB|nr:hypothetical protein [Iamia sp.]HXH56559.1 hypothetical protein [Iamia sp.]
MPTTITIKYCNVITRWPCAVCGNSTEKHAFVAVVEPDDGDSFICEWCLEATAPDLYATWDNLTRYSEWTDETHTAVVPKLIPGRPAPTHAAPRRPLMSFLTRMGTTE